jgi:hypothetical protein
VEHGSSAWALSQPCRHKRPLINIHDESPHRALIVQMLIYPPELGFDKKKRANSADEREKRFNGREG